MVDHSELAAALLQAGKPKPPTKPEPFDYSLDEAIARAKAGSVTDARMLLLLAAGMLKSPIPAAFGNVMLPGALGAYLAEALIKVTRGVEPKRALRLVEKAGNSPATNAERNAWIAYVAAWFKHTGSRRHLSDTANLLSEIGLRPRGGGTWTSQALNAAIRANELKNK